MAYPSACSDYDDSFYCITVSFVGLFFFFGGGEKLISIQLYLLANHGCYSSAPVTYHQALPRGVGQLSAMVRFLVVFFALDGSLVILRLSTRYQQSRKA